MDASFSSTSVTTDAGGNWADDTACYSGDSGEHWVTVDAIESNRVTW